jgi:hypothetical protein
MVDKRDELTHTPQRCVERNLVQILDYYIVVVRREVVPVITVSPKRVCLAISDPVHINAHESCPRRSTQPGAAEEIDAVPPRDDSAEDFLEVELGAACLRILVILPIENEYPH